MMLLALIGLVILVYGNLCDVSNLAEFINAVYNTSCSEVRLTNNITLGSELNLENITNKVIRGNGYYFIVPARKRLIFNNSENVSLIESSIRITGVGKEFFYHLLIVDSKNLVISNQAKSDEDMIEIRNSTDVLLENLSGVFVNAEHVLIYGSKNVTVRNYNLSHGGVIGYILSSEDVKIYNATFHKHNDYWGKGFVFVFCRNVRLEDVLMNRTSMFFLEFLESENIYLNRVNLSNFKSTGILIRRSQNVTINNSNIRNFLKRGIEMWNSSVYIQNTNFTRFVKTGVFVDARTGTYVLNINNSNFLNYVRYKTYICTTGGCEIG